MRAALVLLLAALVSACDPGYVGTWQQADAGASTRYTFFADGRARIVERIGPGEARAYEARYVIDGDSILALSDEQSVERFQIRLTGDTLRIRSPETGQATTLVRVRPGA